MSTFDEWEAPVVDDSRRPPFSVVRRGYERAEVDEYVDLLRHDANKMRSRVRKLKAELEAARQDPYAPASDHVAQMMRALDHEVRQIRAQATDEAERMRSEARTDAETIRQEAETAAEDVRRIADDGLEEAREAAEAIRVDAEERAKESRARADEELREARQESNRVLVRLQHHRESVLKKLRRARNALTEALEDLDPPTDEQQPTDDVILVENGDIDGRIDVDEHIEE